ncbi:MAG: hypothetical protein GXO66_03490 [Euryarchaeota archaeon]|nr:hypothetical protein [Euryarchaeota archaeon]
MGEKIVVPKDAETIADTWVHSNMKNVIGVSYGIVAKHGEAWLVRGEVELWKGLFESEHVGFEMEISDEGEILSVKTQSLSST